MRIIQEQPDDGTYDDLLRELFFVRMVERGLKDSKEGHRISNKEMQHKIKTWQSR